MAYDDDDDLDAVANDIINQIKNQGKALKQVEKAPDPELSPEEVDDFIRNKASQVISDSADVVTELKDVILRGGGTANDIIAFAEVLRSFSGAVEILNKRQIADNKNKTQKEIKEMDIESKKEISSEENTNKLLLSQNDIIKEMLKLVDKDKPEEPKVIDI